jgi:2-polyprenyl-3-methyl-5-hydroxy-6-metoxy-1,4-benzoquinol methylase
MAPSAKKCVEANLELCCWLLDPLARWTYDAYGEKAFDDAAVGYAKYCMGVSQLQKEYEKLGRYPRPEELPQIVSEVYENEGYMVPYMWAAILIYPFWPSMVEHIGFYRSRFLDALPEDARVLELASGHGVMGLLAAEYLPGITVNGFDISPPAVAIAKKLAMVSGHENRVSFSVKDALNLEAAGPKGTYHGVIAAMLAEHLEEPRRLLKIVAHHLAPDGIAFFSTALESAQRDHIYEFNRESEPILMAEEAGLRVCRLICEGSGHKSGRFYPRALAMILKHQ